MMVAAILAGALGIGTVLGGYAILTREMSGAYRATRPASASIEIEGDVEDALRA